MRIVCHASSLDHTSKMLCQLDIFKIYDLIDFNTCIFMYKVFHKLVPLTLQNKFSCHQVKNTKTIFMLCLQEQEESNFQLQLRVFHCGIH